MAYFSNGTELSNYADKYCDNCLHGAKQTDACMVLYIHMAIEYADEKTNRELLDVLIEPNSDGLSHKKCSMFISKDKHKDYSNENQTSFFEG